KNIIIHFFVERALLATGLQCYSDTVSQHELWEHVRYLARLFKYEFRFRSDKSCDDAFSETLSDMIDAQEVSRSGERIGPGPGRNGWTGQKWLSTYASIVRNFLEGYRVVVRSLHPLLDQPLPEKDWIRDAIALGQRMYHAGELERLESISKPMFENALLALQDQGCVRTTQGKLTLTPQYATESSLSELEAKISQYLDRELEL